MIETIDQRQGDRSNQWDTLKDVEFNPKANDQEHDRIISMINDGELDDQSWRQVISRIPGPINFKTPGDIHADLSNAYQQRKILAYMTGVADYQQTSSNQIHAFLGKFPTPIDFEKSSQNFLDMIKAHNSEQKYQEYLSSMNNFKNAIYGKQQTYWDQVKELKSEAKEKLADEFLANLAIDGDEYTYSGQNYRLMPEHLKNTDLKPEFKIKMGDTEIALSKTFLIDDSREAALGYVKTDEGTKLRSYYRSKSSGLWRYLPDYIQDDSGDVLWYGKGYGEEGLTLPTKLQKKLNQINNSPKADTKNIVPEFYFFGSAKRYRSEVEYQTALENGQLSGDYYQDAKKRPSLHFGTLTLQKRRPETIDIQGPFAPNFQSLIDTYQANTNLYGSIDAEIYRSENDAITYTVYKTKDGKVWISNIEPNSNINSTGCYSERISAGDVITPLYEYKKMASGYGDNYDNIGNYTSMWQNYIQKMPIIKRYLSETKVS